MTYNVEQKNMKKQSPNFFSTPDSEKNAELNKKVRFADKTEDIPCSTLCMIQFSYGESRRSAALKASQAMRRLT